jgi:hypothetical protein
VCIGRGPTRVLLEVIVVAVGIDLMSHEYKPAQLSIPPNTKKIKNKINRNNMTLTHPNPTSSKPLILSINLEK